MYDAQKGDESEDDVTVFLDEEHCVADSDSDQGYTWRCWSVINFLQLCQHLPQLCHHILAHSKLSPSRCMCQECIHIYCMLSISGQLPWITGICCLWMF